MILCYCYFFFSVSDAKAASTGASWSCSDEDQELSEQFWRETQPDKVYGLTRAWHTTETCEHERNHTLTVYLQYVAWVCETTCTMHSFLLRWLFLETQTQNSRGQASTAAQGQLLLLLGKLCHFHQTKANTKLKNSSLIICYLVTIIIILCGSMYIFMIKKKKKNFH